MTNILSEKDYQKFLLERLSKDNGYIIRKATNFDRYFAVDREMLFKFLNDTQPDTMDYLRKIYKADLEDTIVSFINTETTKARGSLIEVLKHGIEMRQKKKFSFLENRRRKAEARRSAALRRQRVPRRCAQNDRHGY